MVQHLKLNLAIATDKTFESIGLRLEQIMVLILPPKSVAKGVLSGQMH
jgi:hypothetical protein